MAVGERNSGALTGFAPRDTVDHSSSSFSFLFLLLHFAPASATAPRSGRTMAADAAGDVLRFSVAVPGYETEAAEAATAEATEAAVAAEEAAVTTTLLGADDDGETKLSPTGTRGLGGGATSQALINLIFSDDCPCFFDTEGTS